MPLSGCKLAVRIFPGVAKETIDCPASPEISIYRKEVNNMTPKLEIPFELPELFTIAGKKLVPSDVQDSYVAPEQGACTDGGGCGSGGGCTRGG
jgi:hypothetical protein